MTDANDPTQNFSKATKDALSKKYAPYLSDVTPLSKITSAENMERYITDGIGSWFASRWKMDFLGADKQPLPNVKGLKRWMAHILLTTSVNIQTALPSGNQWFMPANHVLNFELLSAGNPTQLWVSFPYSMKRRSSPKLTVQSRQSSLALSHSQRIYMTTQSKKILNWQ